MGFVYPTLRKSRKPADERVLCFKWGNGNVESHPLAANKLSLEYYHYNEFIVWPLRIRIIDNRARFLMLTS